MVLRYRRGLRGTDRIRTVAAEVDDLAKVLVEPGHGRLDLGSALGSAADRVLLAFDDSLVERVGASGLMVIYCC